MGSACRYSSSSVFGSAGALQNALGVPNSDPEDLHLRGSALQGARKFRRQPDASGINRDLTKGVVSKSNIQIREIVDLLAQGRRTGKKQVETRVLIKALKKS